VKLLPLGEVCTFEYGKPLDKEFRKPDGAFQAYGANGPISAATKYLIEGPCIIVGRKGSAGKITYVEENVWPLDVTYYIKHDPKESDLRYLFYILKSLNIKQFVRGVKPGLNRNDVYKLPIPLPSLENQREIVEKLSSAFAKIDIANNQVRSQSILYSELSAGFIDERITGDQEGFTSSTLKSLTSKIGSGATPRGGEAAYKSEGISLFRSLNVYDDGFRERKLAHLDEDQARALSNVEVVAGDVLLNITGASIARSCIAPAEHLPARVNQHVAIIRPKPELIISEYLHYAICSRSMKEILLGVGSTGGSTRQALTKVDIENTILSYPRETDEQKKIVQELDSFGVLSRNLQENLTRIENLYSELRDAISFSVLQEVVA
jgi:type I restriction enzyme S subunit